MITVPPHRPGMLAGASVLAAALCSAFGCGRVGYNGIALDSDAGQVGDLEAMFGTQLAVGIQGQSASYLARFSYDAASDRIRKSAAPLLLDELEGNKGRGLTRVGSDEILVGGSDTRAIIININENSFVVSGTATFTRGASSGHGLCTLPNDNVLFAEYGGGTGNLVGEHARTSPTTFEFVRPVYVTTVSSGSMSHCVAESDSVVYLTDYAANTDQDGDVVRLELVGDNWMVSHRFDTSTFAVGVYGANHQTAIYSFVLRDDFLYLLPMRRFANQVSRLIRCPLPDITASNCTELGPLPPDSTSVVDGPDTIQGAVLDSQRENVIFATNRHLYRYDLLNDTWQELFDLWASTDGLKDSSGNPDTMDVVRNIVLW